MPLFHSFWLPVPPAHAQLQAVAHELEEENGGQANEVQHVAHSSSSIIDPNILTSLSQEIRAKLQVLQQLMAQQQQQQQGSVRCNCLI